MQRDTDIIILSLFRWDAPYSSTTFSLAKEWSKTNRVFYIDHPYSVKEYFGMRSSGESIPARQPALLYGKQVYRQVEGLPENFLAVTPRLTLPINWLKSTVLYDAVSWLNDQIVLTCLRKVIKDFDIQSYVFLNSYDPFFLRDIPQDIKPEISIYQTVDDISQEPYTARHGVRLEQEAITKADITLATSQELTRLASRYSKHVHCLPNAADFSLFRKAATTPLERPTELQGITQKVICYTGNIGTRINYGLLRKIAQYHTDKMLLMVGPVSNDDYKKEGLDRLPNVLFTGPKSLAELPAYLQHSHCAIIPFEYSLLTKSIYPLKINEYLAAGKPVVATAFSEDIRSFGEVAYVAETDDEFISKIDMAVTEDGPQLRELRMREAENNTWEARADLFWDIVHTHQLAKNPIPQIA